MDKEFYLDNIKVLDWLTNDEYQTIRFKNRIEYRHNGKLDRDDGPAIEYFDGTEEYYKNGEKYEK